MLESVLLIWCLDLRRWNVLILGMFLWWMHNIVVKIIMDTLFLRI